MKPSSVDRSISGAFSLLLTPGMMNSPAGAQVSIRRAFQNAWPVYLRHIGLMTALPGTLFGSWVLLEVLVVAGQSLGFVFWALAHLGFFFVFGGLSAGFIRVCLALYDGEEPAYHDLYARMRLGAQFFAGQFAYLLVVVAGVLLLVFPGLIWGARYSLIFFPLSQPGVGLRESFQESRNLYSKTGSRFIGFWLFQILFNLLGASLLGIGLLVTLPLSALMMTWAYHQLCDRIECG
jgi:hypothetical protein